MVAAFAQRYGVLGIGADGKPGTAASGFPPSVDVGGQAWLSEPLESVCEVMGRAEGGGA